MAGPIALDIQPGSVPSRTKVNDAMNIAANPKDQLAAFRREIPDHNDIIKGELAQNGDWIVANISTNSFWPIVSQKVHWRGVDIWIMPIMKGYYPAVAIMVPPGKSRVECEVLVMRFISMLSWVEEKGFSVEGGALSGGNLPRPMGRAKDSGFSICDEFDLSYFPEVSDGMAGEYEFSAIVFKSGPMLEPLRDPAFFGRVYVEDGAPTWPNGFDVAPGWLRLEIEATGALARDTAA